MSPRVVVIAGILASLACRPDQAPSSSSTPDPRTSAPAPTPASPPIPAGSGVMVRPGGTVWLDAAGTRPIELPEQMPGDGIAMMVVADHGAVLEVETATASACASPLVRDFALRLFVAKTDLRLVTRSRIDHPMSAKDSVRIAAGAPVDGSDGARWIVVANGDMSVKVPIPASDVVDHVPPPLEAGPCVVVLEGAEPAELDIGDPAVWASMIQANTGFTGTPTSVRKGAKVWWSDGSPAGTVAGNHTFYAPIAVAGSRTCLPLALATDNATTLCFESADLTPGNAGQGTIGLGNIGLVGDGGLRAEKAVTGVPRVRQAKAVVVGPLDKDIIRRIVRAHINEIRLCYNQALMRDPVAAGRVVVKFTIGAKGEVETSAPAESSIEDGELTACMATAIKRWKFPKPDAGGTVTVSYPFLLEPGD